HASRLHGKDRAQALAAREDAMTHGLMDGSWVLRRQWQEPFEGGIGGGASLLEDLFQHRPQYNNSRK
ncbi:MAG: hypothetical protein WBQ00_07830, partial [Terriglobales bacterium]